MPKQQDPFDRTREGIEALAGAFGGMMRAGLTGLSKGLDRRPPSPSTDQKQTGGKKQDDSGKSDSESADSLRQAGDAAQQSQADERDPGSLVLLPFHIMLDVVTETSRELRRALDRGEGKQDSETKAPDQRPDGAKGPPYGGAGKERLYAEPGNRVYPPQPFKLRQCDVDAYWVEGNLEKIQAFCDTLFSKPTENKVSYRVLTPKLVVFRAKIASLSSIEAGSPIVPEIDCAIWAVAYRERPLPRVVFIPLYLFVDHGTAQAAGREIYGFPKHHAKFEEKDGVLTVQALVGHFEADADRSDWKTVLTLNRKQIQAHDQPQATIQELNGTLAQAFLRLERASLGILIAAVEKLLLNFGKIPMAFLKQFRSPKNGTRADYQAVVEAALKVDKLNSWGSMVGQGELTVQDYPQLAIAKTLGLQAGDNKNILHPAVTLNLDLTLETGEVLWTS